MKRIIVHWTAGAHFASDFDRSHYHLRIEGDGYLVRGKPSIALNGASGAKPGYGCTGTCTDVPGGLQGVFVQAVGVYAAHELSARR